MEHEMQHEMQHEVHQSRNWLFASQYRSKLKKLMKQKIIKINPRKPYYLICNRSHGMLFKPAILYQNETFERNLPEYYIYVGETDLKTIRLEFINGEIEVHNPNNYVEFNLPKKAFFRGF